MAPLPDVPGVLRINPKWTFASGGSYGCRFFMSYSGGTPSVADANAIINEFATAWGATLKTYTSSEVSLTSVTVRDLATATGVNVTGSVSVAGTDSNPQPLASACVVLKANIDLSYRGGHSRLYLPCGTTGDQANEAHWISTFPVAVYNAWITLLHALEALSLSVVLESAVVVKYYKGYTTPVTLPSGRVKQTAALNPAGPSVYTINSYSADTRIGSQRRRRGKT